MCHIIHCWKLQGTNLTKADLLSLDVVFCLHCSNNQNNACVCGLGHVGPASEGDGVESLGEASELWFGRHPGFVGLLAYVALATLALPVKVTELKVLARPVSCGSGDILALLGCFSLKKCIQAV